MEENTYRKSAQIITVIVTALWAALTICGGIYVIVISVQFENWKWLIAAFLIWVFGGLFTVNYYFTRMFRYELGSNVESLVNLLQKQLNEESIRDEPHQITEELSDEPQAVVEGVSGSLTGVTFEVGQYDEVILGRDPAVCHLVLQAEGVSRQHCSIRYDRVRQQYCVTDFSTNGTYAGTNLLQKKVPIFVNRGTVLTLGLSEEQFCLK